MEHRQIVSPTKTGTISQTKARGAARFAKTAKEGSSGRTTKRSLSSGAYQSKHSSYFGFPLPATAEPKGWKPSKVKTSKLGSSRSRKKTTKHSAKRFANTKSFKRGVKVRST